MVEALRLPRAALSPPAIALVLGEGYLALGVVAPAMLLAAVAPLLALRWPRAGTVPVVALVAGALGAWISYATLIGYARFAGHLPFMVAWGGLALFLAALYAITATGRSRRVAAIGAAVAVAAAVLGLVLAARFRDYYPTLHVSLGISRALLFHAAAAVGLRELARWPRRVAMLTASAVVMLAAGAIASGVIGDGHTARRAALEHTVLGAVAALEGSPIEDSCARPPPPLTDEEANAALAAVMPALPASVELAGMDVVLVMSEAIRFDQTSLAGHDTTPSLARFAADGAFVFGRAYAPASRTWLSLAALFSMAHPAQAPLTTKVPPWTGDLEPAAETVAELYSRAGYQTAAFRHDFEGNAGLDQGFATVHQEPGRVLPRELIDRNLVLRAIDALAVPSGAPRFTWVFLISPHEPYLGATGTFEGYQQALRHTDAEFGRLLAFLDESGRRDRTIVIFAADHGEEFREHGHFARHGLTLYEEVVHVPLVVRIPGVSGVAWSRPISLVALFPWLMSRGAPVLRAAATAAVRDRLAPVWRATDGAAAMENLDESESYLALATPDHKLHFDLRSRRLEVYELATDGAEHNDLALTGGPAVVRATALVAAYRQIRACTRRAVVSELPGPTRDNRQRVPAVPYQARSAAGRAATGLP